MLRRYDLIVDVSYPDDVAIMYPSETGHYVKAEDAQESIDFLVAALQSLKHCNIKLTSPEELNLFVDKTLAGYHDD